MELKGYVVTARTQTKMSNVFFNTDELCKDVIEQLAKDFFETFNESVTFTGFTRLDSTEGITHDIYKSR